MQERHGHGCMVSFFRPHSLGDPKPDSGNVPGKPLGGRRRAYAAVRRPNSVWQKALARTRSAHDLPNGGRWADDAQTHLLQLTLHPHDMLCSLAFTMRSEASRKLLRLNIFSVLTLNQTDHGEGEEWPFISGADRPDMACRKAAS